ncbi:MAG: divalent-cation tolerance protein CutA [Rhizomicrobium sp.]
MDTQQTATEPTSETPGQTEFVILYSTFPATDAGRDAADVIARHLLEARLIACANIFAPMTSLYRWQGKIESDTEFGVFFKTRRSLVSAAIDAAKARHPYTLPCFLTLPVEGDTGYLDWLKAETAAIG